MKRMVRILRSTVMVRVGGGWEPLDKFLLKHDPCRTKVCFKFIFYFRITTNYRVELISTCFMVIVALILEVLIGLHHLQQEKTVRHKNSHLT